MKMNIRVQPVGPSVDSETLLKFIIKKCAEIIEQNRQNLPRIWVALTLAAVSPRRRILHGTQANHLFVCLTRNNSGHVPEHFPAITESARWCANPEWVDAKEKYPAATEKDYKRLLLYALREGKKMMDSRNYEWVKVFESLTWIGLQFYALQVMPI